MDYASLSLTEHAKHHGLLGTSARVPLETRDHLSTYYTPGIAAVSKAIAEDPAQSWNYTNRANSVAIVSDGSAVLGLGSLGPEAAMPVMTGKALLFSELAGIDATPLVLQTENQQEIINTIRALAPSFGGVNLEDIAAPHCFAIEAALQDLGIPVMHDDQHGTAVVVSAALQNAFSVLGKNLEDSKIVVNGAGAAGSAIIAMLCELGANSCEIIALDSKGILSTSRPDLSDEKRALAEKTNPKGLTGSLADALTDADCVIGVSKGGTLTAAHIAVMAPNPIVFALANPMPEIFPEEALAAGAAIVATGRSDFPNQVNNALAFPGIFRGALDAGAYRITRTMLAAATKALASAVPNPSHTQLLPDPLDRSIAHTIAKAVVEAAIQEGNTRSL